MQAAVKYRMHSTSPIPQVQPHTEIPADAALLCAAAVPAETGLTGNTFAIGEVPICPAPECPARE